MIKKSQQWFLYLTVFVSGAVVLIIEILGTRIISPFYGATIFVWSSLITVTLGFLALGYYWGGRLVDKKPRVSLVFQVLLAAAGLVVLILKLDQKVLVFTDRYGMKFGPLAASLLLFAPVFLSLGMVTPMVIRLLSKSVKKSGETAGNVFAVSTAGSVLGAVLAGFFLLPKFSLTEIFMGAAGVLGLIALIGLWWGKSNFLSGLIVFLGVVLLVPKLIDSPKNTYRLIDQRQSFFGDIKVVEISNYRCLYVNGSGQTCIDEEGRTDGFFQRFLKKEIVNLGLDKGSRILLLGLGGGGILSLLPEEVGVDIVEIDPEIVKVAKEYFGFEQRQGDNLIIDDARHFLGVAEGGKYDLVLENVALGNSIPAYLLSQESFVEMKRVLKPGGVLWAHVGSHEIEGDNQFNQAVYSTARPVFDYGLALSSQKNQVANLVLYLSDKPIEYGFKGEAKEAKLVADQRLIVTDEKNPLEYWYVTNAISQRENTKPLGKSIFYVK